MTVRKPEDLTLEEVRKQMALYQRLYYHKVKETPEYKNKKNPETILFKKKCEKKKRKKQMKTLVKNHQNKPKETTLKKYKKDVNEASIIV